MTRCRFLPLIFTIAACSTAQVGSGDPAPGAVGSGNDGGAVLPGDGSQQGASVTDDAGKHSDASSSDAGNVSDASTGKTPETRTAVDISSGVHDAVLANGKLWFVTDSDLRVVDDAATGTSHAVASWTASPYESSVAVGTSQVFVAHPRVNGGAGNGYVADITAIDIGTGTVHAVGTVPADTASGPLDRYPITADGDTAFIAASPNIWKAKVGAGVVKVSVGSSNYYVGDLVGGPGGFLYGIGTGSVGTLDRFDESGGSSSTGPVTEVSPGLVLVTSDAVYSTDFGSGTHTIQRSDLALTTQSTFASFGAFGLGTDGVDLYATRQTTGMMMVGTAITSTEIVAVSLATGAVDHVYAVQCGTGVSQHTCNWGERQSLGVTSTHVFAREGSQLVAFPK